MLAIFEKIIEKLEKLSDELYKAYCIGFNSDDRAEYDAYINAIEIVKQEAEKFGRETNVGSNGCIPCSERLPEKLCHNLLVTYEDRYIGGVYDVCEGQYVHCLNEWHISDYDIVDDFNVIAWCEKPVPYQPKGEING